MIVISILFLAFFQQVATTIASRARNRDKRLYHLPFSLFSHLLFGISLIVGIQNTLDVQWLLFYTLGATAGNMLGSEIAMKIEPRINALADSWREV